MAIIKSGDKKLPQKLQELLTGAFSLQAVRDTYKKAYESKTKEIKVYLKKLLIFMIVWFILLMSR